MIYLGIDIGGTRTKVGLVDDDGRILRSEAATSPGTREALIATLHDLIRAVMGDTRADAAGFGCKGVVDPATTEVRTMPGLWHFTVGLRLRDFVEPFLKSGAPVGADNDAKAALAGEMVWGAARGRSDVLLLTLGTGVGGAILSGGRLLRGHGGVAGHLGHITADPNGAPCICGNYGCLETVFSARAIEAEAWTATHQGCASPMCDTLRANPGALNTRFVFEQAAHGDHIANGILERKCRILGASIAGLIHALDPEIVILSGSIADAGLPLFETIQAEVDWRIQGLLRRSVPIVPSGVADTSGVVGAAGVARLALV